VDIVAGAATHRIKGVDLRVQRKTAPLPSRNNPQNPGSQPDPGRLLAVRRARSTTAAFAESQAQQTMQTPNRGKTRTPWGSAHLWSEPLHLSVGATFLGGK